MDWLTEEWISKVYDEAWEKWKTGDDVGNWCDYWHKSLVRAAARKVVDEHEKAIHSECPLPRGGDDAYSKVTHCHAQWSCRQCKSDYFLQALRQEVAL